MTSSGLPENVHQFLLEHIDSLEQLEVLLLLHRDRRPMRADDVARELRIAPESAVQRLEALARKAILSVDASGVRYSYDAQGAVDATISDLARFYAERRVTVINFIATKHLERIKSFADAFRWKGGGGK